MHFRNHQAVCDEYGLDLDRVGVVAALMENHVIA
jgi:hypothetical protein